MPKRKKRKKQKAVPIRIRVFVFLLLAVLVAGIGSVKLLRTTKGQVILLDAGFSSYYAPVQRALDAELRRSLIPFGLQKHLREESRPTKFGEKRYVVRHWETSCSEPCSSAKISLAFAKAARRVGGDARSELEGRSDDATGDQRIVITAGSRKYSTHRITIHTSRHEHSRRVTKPFRSDTPKLALVIDDFGYARSDLTEAFFEIDLPLTISVIPSLARTRYAIERAKDAQKELILHLPMEAENYEPEEGFIATAMDDERIMAMVEGYLQEMPGIVGVNNHLGSLATRDGRVMRAVMTVIKDHDMFFLDSLTSSESIAYNTARSMDVPAAKNDLFLDDDTKDPLVVEERLLHLITLAKKRGRAVGIGHPRKWTFEAISRNEEILKESGVDLVFVSEMMK